MQNYGISPHSSIAAILAFMLHPWWYAAHVQESITTWQCTSVSISLVRWGAKLKLVNITIMSTSNDNHDILNCRSIECFFSSMSRLTTKKHQRFTLLSLCEGNQQVTSGFPHTKGSNSEMFPFHDVIMVTKTPDKGSSLKFPLYREWLILMAFLRHRTLRSM